MGHSAAEVQRSPAVDASSELSAHTVFVLFRTKKVWNMTGDGALICSVDCFAHTSPHVGASLGLPATPPPATTTTTFSFSLPPHAPLPPLLSGSPECCAFSEASARRRRWPQSYAAVALPLKDNSVYCVCQASAPILWKSIAHLLL